MDSSKFEQAKQYAISRLERELSPHYHYHGFAHTCEEVVPATEELARMEGIHGKPLHLLLTAAWFHDLGYVEKPIYHELISARIAVQVLPSFGFSKHEVEIIRWAILSTALPQWPRNRLEEILVDADLYVLGGENFMPRNADLRRELAFLGKEFTDEEWYLSQLKFVEGHTYFTASAHALRDGQKAMNIAELESVLEGFRQR